MMEVLTTRVLRTASRQESITYINYMNSTHTNTHVHKYIHENTQGQHAHIHINKTNAQEPMNGIYIYIVASFVSIDVLE